MSVEAVEDIQAGGLPLVVNQQMVREILASIMATKHFTDYFPTLSRVVFALVENIKEVPSLSGTNEFL